MINKIAKLCILCVGFMLAITSCSIVSDLLLDDEEETETQETDLSEVDIAEEEMLKLISPENVHQMEMLAEIDKGWIEDITWSRDGQKLVVGGPPIIFLFDGVTYEEIGIIDTQSTLYSAAISPDNLIVASGSKGWLRLWDAASGELLTDLEAHTDAVTSLDFSPNGQLLASGSWDKTICLWDVESGSLVRKIEGHEGGVRSVAFSPDGHVLASASGDDTIRLWNVDTGDLLRILEGHTGQVHSVAFSPDGLKLVSGSDDKTVRLWDTVSGNLINTMEGNQVIIHSVAFTPDGTVIASGGCGSSALELWDTNSGELLRSFNLPTGCVLGLDFSPDGQKLAFAGGDDLKLSILGFPSNEANKSKFGPSFSVEPTLTPIPLLSIMSDPTEEIRVTNTPEENDATSTPTEKPSGPFEYVVQEGDSCEGIAIDFGISVQSIIQINNLSEDCTLFVGDVLLIVPPTPTSEP